jgi:hypothetical protein
MTKLEICNLSLDRLAIEPITELDFTGSSSHVKTRIQLKPAALRDT